MGHSRAATRCHCSRCGKEDWERNGVENKWKVSASDFYFYSPNLSSSLRLPLSSISYISMMNMNFLWSRMVWGQVAEDWQRDWPRLTARQIVILPTNLTLSSGRLMFLGKSHSACCPVISLQLAEPCGWMTGWGKTGSCELIRRRKWWGCGWTTWMKEWIRFSAGRVSVIGHNLHPPLVLSHLL